MRKNEHREPKREERRERKSEDGMCGASDAKGVRFPVPDHHGLHESENKPKAP
jgi:hypothetical protein